MKLTVFAAAICLLSGCTSIGLSASGKPTANSNVTLGASVDGNGTIKPTGGVSIRLF